MKATGGRGVDVILEMAAHINLDKDISVLAKFGRIVVIGSRGTHRDRSARHDGTRGGDSSA